MGGQDLIVGLKFDDLKKLIVSILELSLYSYRIDVCIQVNKHEILVNLF